MDRERWQYIKPILAEALDLPTGERSEFILAACGGDISLKRDVDELLAHASTDALETPAIEEFLGPAENALLGTQVDRYKLISELGSGGMGSVYLAERDEGTFVQRVALKLIRRGLASDEILSRFLNERLILASLQHEYIAHLIDGGTSDEGDPFIVMEYVEGLPITEYAAKHDLSLDDRLRLFVDICSAVSYAHQNLVIHRDLKPSNILVTKQGKPKLLDFGIAKILDVQADGQAAATQRFIFTPEYASPEQVRGDNLTTATDVYSLGVVLYELLTGARPYKTTGTNISKVIEIVCQREPTAPSRLKTASTDPEGATAFNPFANLLKGDLDKIVLKALRKEPERRYSSVAAFTQDIRSYLSGMPVAASSGTWTYKTGKFVRRHRLGVAAGTIAAVSLFGGFAITLDQVRIATTERAKAEKRFNDVRHLANSFVFEINDEIEKSPIKARALVVQRAIEYLDNLATESGNDASLLGELAAAYEKVGDVQSEIFKPNLGNSGGALESHTKALDIRSRLAANDPDNISAALDLAKSEQKVGSLMTVIGDVTGALPHYRKAVAISEKATASDPGSKDAEKVLLNAHLHLGQAIFRTGSLSESLDQYQNALTIASRMVEDTPTNESMRRLSVTLSYIGYVKILMGDPEKGAEDFRRSLDLEQRIWDSDPHNLHFKENVGAAQVWLGLGYRESGRLSESLALIDEGLAIQQAMADADPDNFGEKNSLADCLAERGQTLERSGRSAAAIKDFQKAIELYSLVAEKDQADLAARFQIQLMRRLMADSLLHMERHSEAATQFKTALEALVPLTERDPGNLDWKFEKARTQGGLGMAMTSTGRRSEGSEQLNEALAIIDDLIAASPENRRYGQVRNEIQKALAAASVK